MLFPAPEGPTSAVVWPAGGGKAQALQDGLVAIGQPHIGKADSGGAFGGDAGWAGAARRATVPRTARIRPSEAEAACHSPTGCPGDATARTSATSR